MRLPVCPNVGRRRATRGARVRWRGAVLRALLNGAAIGAGLQEISERIVLNAGTETSLHGVRLEVGSLSKTVEVSVPQVIVQTDNAEVSNTILRQQVQDLPIPNLSPQGFVDTQAGVTLGRGGDSVINGQRTSFTNVTLDGINIQDNYICTNAVDFSPNLLLLRSPR